MVRRDVVRVSADAADAGCEASDVASVGPVAVALRGEQVWLFDESDLYFKGSDKRNETGDADDVWDWSLSTQWR